MAVKTSPPYFIVNVKNYPLEHSQLPPDQQLLFEPEGNAHPSPRRLDSNWRQRFKIEKLPRAYIGNSPRRYTFVPFCILLATASVAFLAYIVLSIQYFSIIAELELHPGILICFALCLIDAFGAIVGLKVLSKSVVSSGKLFLLHAIMFFGMLLHMFLPVYEFVPQYRPNNQEDQDGGNSFPAEYWACRGTKDEEQTVYTGFCDRVLGIGNMFWSTIILFLVLFIAWRIALCGRPTPIHPEAKTSSELRRRRRTVRRDQLASIYRTWQEASAVEKPYFAHFPKPNIALSGVPLNEDDNANIIPITEEVLVHDNHDELTDSSQEHQESSEDEESSQETNSENSQPKK